MILAILQARVSSTRLPGKVLKTILAKPLLCLQIERVRRSRKIDRLVVATSVHSDDAEIEALCRNMGTACFRGSLDDVLDRFYQCALLYKPNHVLRLTGDCPLIDPQVADDLIEFYLKGEFDYASNTLQPTFPNGLDAEIFRFAALEAACREARLPSQREHVTPFIHQNPGKFRIGHYKGGNDLSHLRWTVDEPEDFEFVSKVYEALYPLNPQFATADVLELLSRHPELLHINSGIARNEGLRKSLEADKAYLKKCLGKEPAAMAANRTSDSSGQDKMKVVFRVDASVETGIGHVMRCLTLADELRERGAGAEFVCREEKGNLIDHIEEKGYTVHRLARGANAEADNELTQQVLKDGSSCPEWLVVDHYGLDVAWESSVRKAAKSLMAIDDFFTRRHDSDLLLNQNFTLRKSLYDDGVVPDRCVRLFGPTYALLRPQFRHARETLRGRSGEAKRILVFMGGADISNETCKVLRALGKLRRESMAVDVVIGVSSPHRRQVERLASETPGATCHFRVEDMAALMAATDLAIGTAGTTTWERCCMGLPALVITAAANQMDVAESLDKHGVLINLGWHEAVSERDIESALREFLDRRALLREMSHKGMELVDGQGAIRVAERLMGYCAATPPTQADFPGDCCSRIILVD